jgi:hypothetical protein
LEATVVVVFAGGERNEPKDFRPNGGEAPSRPMVKASAGAEAVDDEA